MFELEKAIIITNNDRVAQKYKDKLQIKLLDTYEEVLIKTRDLIYDRHILLTHPQASSLKPNQTPYRSVVVYPKENNDNTKDIIMIENCINTFRQWQEIVPTPKKYEEGIAYDFKTIDLSVIENIIPKIL